MFLNKGLVSSKCHTAKDFLSLLFLKRLLSFVLPFTYFFNTELKIILRLLTHIISMVFESYHSQELVFIPMNVDRENCRKESILRWN